jgi:hypothetical protein
MKATTALGWIKNQPVYLLTILLLAASSYAMDRWFFSGLTASKWIGLPQYASAMSELQNESRNWGIVAMALEFAALASVWPRWPKESLALTENSLLNLGAGLNARSEYLGRCMLRIGLCLLGTLLFAIVIPLVFGSFGAILRPE